MRANDSVNRVVIIDADTSFSKELAEALSSPANQAASFDSWHSAQPALENSDLLLVILNAALPDANGIELTWTLRQKPNAPEILIISDSPGADDAEQAIRSGAWDYLARPANVKSLIPIIERMIEYAQSSRRNRNENENEAALFAGIVGESPKIRACLTLAGRAANSEANVLIHGETGTGKELFAWAIHKNSSRANGNFVVVDCAALPETLVESTLMGHERGAFTGADRVQDGLIKQADGGTLFLDEVGELPLAIQKSFLRVLEERQFRRVGGKEEIRSDFRLLSASNKNLDDLVQEGKFREDLLFRLRSFSIELPPLRERKTDIKSIILFHLPRLCNRISKDIKEISDEYFDDTMLYQWPGNVRELVNALDRSIIAARNEKTLFPQHLPTYLRIFLARERATRRISASTPFCGEPRPPDSLRSIRESALGRAEEEYLRLLIKTTRGNMAEACRIAGVSRSRLYSLLKKYRISLS
jgi:two-component system NtrC family response regulator